MAKKLTRELILWRDAWSGYGTPTEPADVEVGNPGYFLVSTGFLVKENRDEVIIALETNATAGDERVRHLSGILKKNIVSRRSSVVSVPDPQRKKK